MMPETDFDVALSFAGEDRDFVSQVADHLKMEGITVFYDKSHEVALWGTDLTVVLDDAYRKRARYVVLFLSAAYAKKAWTTFEKAASLAGAIARVGQDFILPARFDDTDIPGLIPTISYIDLRNHTPQTFAGLIAEKVRSQRSIDDSAEQETLQSIIDAWLVKSPFRTQADVVQALDLRDWPTSVSLGMFKSAPKPTNSNDIQVTEFKSDIIYRVVLRIQTEQHLTFKLASCPSRKLRDEYRRSSAGAKEFAPVDFNSPDKADEHATGVLTYETCDSCEGAGTVTETCRVCSGKGLLEEASQVRCHNCRSGNVVTLCGQCGATGYLDIFPLSGRRVSRKDYVLFGNAKQGTIPSTSTTYNSVRAYGIQKTLPNQVPFRDVDPALSKRYAEVANVVQRKDAPPEPSVALIQHAPFKEKRDISVYRMYLNGCQFRIEACKIYKISYTRNIKYTKGLLKKEDMTTVISGSLRVLDNGTMQKVAESHSERV